MKGKDKCELLKSIRKRLAEMNDIEYAPTPCDHEGECRGTCPRCDKEAEWLMEELRKKEEAGLPIQIDVDSFVKWEDLAHDDAEDIVCCDMPDEEPIEETMEILPPEDYPLLGCVLPDITAENQITNINNPFLFAEDSQ